jgi:CYTH domain-containing protein/thymidylate kinase
MKIYRIVLTGGPGAGKTSVLKHIKDHFEKLGWKVMLAPEVATILFTAGLEDDRNNSPTHTVVQSLFLEMQLAMEKVINKAVKIISKPTLIIYDRGLLDGKAFCSENEWWNAINMTPPLDSYTAYEKEAMMSTSYDAVIHLETSAALNSNSYVKETNPIRKEDAAEAIKYDKRTYDAWSGHFNHSIIYARENFQEKIDAVISTIEDVVQTPLEIERKFLVTSINDILIPHSKSIIAQTYLRSMPELEDRVRRIINMDSDEIQYVRTMKCVFSPNVRAEHEWVISKDEYNTYMDSLVDPYYKTIIKERVSFEYDGVHYDLDTYKVPHTHLGMIVLEAELDKEDQKVNLPSFLKIEKEITNDKQYRNKEIARRTQC